MSVVVYGTHLPTKRCVISQWQLTKNNKDAKTSCNSHYQTTCLTHANVCAWADVKLLCYNTETLNHPSDANTKAKSQGFGKAGTTVDLQKNQYN